MQNDGALVLYLGLLNATAAMDLYTNMQQVGAQTFSSLTDMIINGQKRKLNAQDFAATFIQSVELRYCNMLLPKSQWRVTHGGFLCWSCCTARQLRQLLLACS
jgi:hypothetical protein